MAEDSNIMTYVLVGIGAYLVYNYFTSQATAATVPMPIVAQAPNLPTTTNQPASPPATGSGQSAPSASVSMPVPAAAQLEQAAAGAGYTAPYYFNLYQWNYFYTTVTGQSTTPLRVFSGDPNATMTSAQYVSMLPSYFSQNGLGRLGVVQRNALRRGAGVYGWN